MSLNALNQCVFQSLQRYCGGGRQEHECFKCSGKSLQLHPCLYFLFAQSFQVSQNYDHQDFLGHSWMCTVWYVCDLLEFQEYARTFQSLLWTSQSLGFHFKNLVSFLLFPTGNIASGSCNVKQLLLIVFDKCSVDRALFTK